MKSKKLPSWQFYPGDWQRDPGVQALDYESRGIWFEILLIMFDSEQRGKLVLNGQKMPEEALAQLLKLDQAKLKQTLSKLVSYGVAKVEQNTGILYNRRLLKDEQFRTMRAEAGKIGGKQSSSKRQANAKQKSTPSSSSSSSVVDISVISELPLVRNEEIAGLNVEAWNRWIDYRKKLKLKPYKTNQQAKALAKYSPEVQLKTVEESIRQQWQGLFPEKTQGAENGKTDRPTNAFDRAKQKLRDWEQSQGGIRNDGRTLVPDD